MDCNSKIIKAVAKSLSVEVNKTFLKVCAKKSCEGNKNWEIYGQEETTNYTGAFVQVPSLK